jgi:hypothetical protein
VRLFFTGSVARVWALHALEGLGQAGAPRDYCFLPSVMLFVVMNGAGAGVQRLERVVLSGAATRGWPQGAASLLNKADGIHRGRARARVCGVGDAGVWIVDCGVGIGAGEKADDEFVSHI